MKVKSDMEDLARFVLDTIYDVIGMFQQLRCQNVDALCRQLQQWRQVSLSRTCHPIRQHEDTCTAHAQEHTHKSTHAHTLTYIHVHIHTTCAAAGEAIRCSEGDSCVICMLNNKSKCLLFIRVGFQLPSQPRAKQTVANSCQ